MRAASVARPGPVSSSRAAGRRTLAVQGVRVFRLEDGRVVEVRGLIAPTAGTSVLVDDTGVTAYTRWRKQGSVEWREVDGARWHRELPPIGEVGHSSFAENWLELRATSGRVVQLLTVNPHDVRNRQVRPIARLLWALHERDVRMEGRPLPHRAEVRAIWAAAGRDPATGQYLGQPV